ncbi:DMT family transporter [bacterium]|nr:DMT family transporter [bacterium]
MWILLSIGTAVFLSLRDFYVKERTTALDSLTLSWSLYLFSIPLMAVITFILGVPDFSGWCVKAMLIGGGCDALASLLYVQALRSGDLSKAIPMLSFIPVFQLLSAPLVLSEYPSLPGTIGVIIVVIGTYVINITRDSGGKLGPFRSLLKDRSCQFMLGVALLWSISAMYHKIGVRSYPTYFWVFMVTIFIAVVLYPFIHYFSGPPWKKVFGQSKRLFLPAVFHISTLLTLYAAIALTQVAYVSSIRRLSILISILLGIFILKEGEVKSKLIGGSLMVSGAIIIALANVF